MLESAILSMASICVEVGKWQACYTGELFGARYDAEDKTEDRT